MKVLYDTAGTILIAILALLWAALAAQGKSQAGLYIISVILIWLVLFIKPVLEYIFNKGKEEYDAFKAVFIVFGGILSPALSIMMHDVIYLDNIRASSGYGLYGHLILITILYFLSAAIFDMVKDFRNRNDKDGYLSQYIRVSLKFLLVIVFSFMIPFYQLYDRRFDVSFSNLDTPVKLEAELMNGPETAENAFKPHLKGTIDDKQLIEDLIAEVRAMKLDNIRNLDKLNYHIMKDRSYPYIKIHGYYNPDYPSLLGNVEQGAFSSIEVYTNGQVVLTSYNAGNNVLKQNNIQYFRVPLSDNIMYRLRQTLKTLFFEYN